jgi:hypothetical protein
LRLSPWNLFSLPVPGIGRIAKAQAEHRASVAVATLMTRLSYRKRYVNSTYYILCYQWRQRKSLAKNTSEKVVIRILSVGGVRISKDLDSNFRLIQGAAERGDAGRVRASRVHWILTCLSFSAGVYVKRFDVIPAETRFPPWTHPCLLPFLPPLRVAEAG